jgi:glyoxylase-like metal-dependent hydrolase (beta-lactamase superfamily II)
MSNTTVHSARHYQIGDATVSRVEELVLPDIPASYLFPEWDTKLMGRNVPWLGPENISTNAQTLALSVHTWVVRIAGLTVLIDTGAGNGKHRPLNPTFNQLDNPYMQRLAAAGVTPEAVTHVVITHLHVDHVGWNTVWSGDQWVPAFPNATYLFSRAEYEFYADASHVQTPSAGVFEDSVQPIVDAGQARFIGTGEGPLIDGLTLHGTKGHSYGHLSVSLESAGQFALFSGDVMHHPVQVAVPEWNSVFCEFPDDARRSRMWALQFAAENNALFCSSHFPGTSAGWIERRDQEFVWLPS